MDGLNVHQEIVADTESSSTFIALNWEIGREQVLHTRAAAQWQQASGAITLLIGAHQPVMYTGAMWVNVKLIKYYAH